MKCRLLFWKRSDFIQYKIILWDFDGTLANTGADVWESIRFAAREFNAALPKDYTTDNRNLSCPISEIFRQMQPFPGANQVNEFQKLLEKHYRFQNTYENTVFYPGISELLDTLNKRQCLNFIITMKPDIALKRVLAIKKWDRKFIKTFSPDSISGKMLSKSEMLALVLDTYSLDKSQCVYIGDSWSDVKAARENGIASIGVTYGDGDQQLLMNQKPQLLVDDSRDLADILLKEVPHVSGL